MAEKVYKLDLNHSPDMYKTDTIYLSRVRSGDDDSIGKLGELDSFFAREFGYSSASFFDFSPFSIAHYISFVLPKDAPLAYSAKLSYFCMQAIEILSKSGVKTITVEADKSGSLSKESMRDARTKGAEYLFCAAVDEDTFLMEEMENIFEFFPAQKTILDISNAVKRVDTPKTLLSILWGYKLGSFKHSGVALCEYPNAAMLENIDIGVYGHLKSAYECYGVDEWAKQKRDLFLSILNKEIGNDIFYFVDTELCLANSVYIGFDGILARDFIRTLALDGIYVTNGELCSLALSKPSRILQSIGYGEDKARNGISISFEPNITDEEIKYVASKIAFRYKQLKAILS
ncbi:MAG: hypothetical protein PHE67_11255 [Campylobacterales bacterium]|nr:hypothetical protein [Campylobacterales bacterium]